MTVLEKKKIINTNVHIQLGIIHFLSELRSPDQLLCAAWSLILLQQHTNVFL